MSKSEGGGTEFSVTLWAHLREGSAEEVGSV